MSKCGHAYGLDYNDWDPALLQLTIERSLKRLRTDHLDLLQLHSCSERELRKGHVIEVLQKARAAGKTRFIGYSGDSRAALYAVESGAFDTLQTSVNIADQEAISLSISRAQEKGLGVIGKRSVANVAWKFSEAPEVEFVRPYWERLQRLRYEFLQGTPEEVLRTALSFTLSIPGLHTALVGTVNPDHLLVNLPAAPLRDSDYQSIRERWLSVAPPDWTAASEVRGVSLATRVKDSLRRMRRSLRRVARP
jgi:aryl-alcohol dehydrogenase-like predicted oxidoreductase